MGHVDGPLELVPHKYCSWGHRFDHPDPANSPVYRTLYCADERATCFGELFDRFSPSMETAKELLAAYGEAPDPVTELEVEYLSDKSIAQGRVRIHSGDLVDLDDPGIRKWLERHKWDLFREHRVKRFDISAARSRRRPMTKEIGRFLYQEGAAGIIYGSNVDNQRCFALFEGRAELEPLTEKEPLAGLLDEIEPVLRKLDLRIAT